MLDERAAPADAPYPFVLVLVITSALVAASAANRTCRAPREAGLHGPRCGFSLAGSRCGDRRVCALWIGENRPRLGWCWAGNPHTGLGTASCAGRDGVPIPGG